MKNVKDLLKNEREESYVSLAEKLGLTRQCLMNIESGRTQPRLLTLKKICDYFGENFIEYIDDKEA